jgi:hypothetical protein
LLQLKNKILILIMAINTSPVGTDFLALPKPHHHVSRLLVLIIILAIIGGAVWAYSYYLSDRRTDVATTSPAPTTDPSLVKNEILNQTANPSVSMSDAEIKAKKAQLAQPNPTEKLTNEQIKAKEAALQQM